MACPFKLIQKLEEEEVSFEKNVGEREKVGVQELVLVETNQGRPYALCSFSIFGLENCYVMLCKQKPLPLNFLLTEYFFLYY